MTKKHLQRGVCHRAGFTYHKKQICRGDQWSPAGVQWTPLHYKRTEIFRLCPIFLTSTAFVDTNTIFSYKLWGSLTLAVMGLLCKRYDMIALLLQAAPKVHHNLPKAIITLNSPEAIIAGDLLCGRIAKQVLFLIFFLIFPFCPWRKEESFP